MKPKELIDLTNEELAAKEDELRKEYFNLKFQLAAGRMESPARFTQIRRDIARIKTALRQREAGSST